MDVGRPRTQFFNFNPTLVSQSLTGSAFGLGTD